MDQGLPTSFSHLLILLYASVSVGLPHNIFLPLLLLLLKQTYIRDVAEVEQTFPIIIIQGHREKNDYLALDKAQSPPSGPLSRLNCSKESQMGLPNLSSCSSSHRAQTGDMIPTCSLSRPSPCNFMERNLFCALCIRILHSYITFMLRVNHRVRVGRVSNFPPAV